MSEIRIFLQNVPEHAPSPAGASVDPHNAAEPTGKPENSAAGDGCRVSTCSLSDFEETVRASTELELVVKNPLTKEVAVFRVMKSGGFWYVGELEFVRWIVDQLTELRYVGPPSKASQGRKLYKRTGDLEKYLVSPVDYVGAELACPDAHPVDENNEGRVGRDLGISERTEADESVLTSILPPGKQD